jgi:hypothetical protein
VGEVSVLTENKKLVGLILALLILVYLASVGKLPAPSLPKFQLTPGPEGVRAIVYGVQFGSGSPVLVASNLDPLPPGYSWGSTQSTVMTLQHLKQAGEPAGGFLVNGPGWWYENDQATLRVEVQRPFLQDDPIGLSSQTLSYYRYTRVSDTEVKIEKVVARVIPADFILQLSAEPPGVYTWRDTRIWLALDTVTWMNAYASSPPPDPNPLTNESVKFIGASYRGAFPVIAWVGEYKDWVFKDDKGNYRSNPPDDNAVSFVQVDPSLAGRFIDLYKTPNQKYDLVLAADVARNPGLLSQALSPGWLPDPRFAETVYTYWTLNSFGAYVQPTGLWGSYSSSTIWYPALYYRIRVVYVVYGEYVYLWTTKTAGQVGYTPGTWELRETTKESTADPITAFLRALFGNPLALLGAGLFAFLIILGLAGLLLFWFFGLPAGVRRRRE